jgi:hypothetical protein
VIFADGDRAGYERRIPGQRPIPFERKEPVAPSLTLLSQYAGVYSSAELAGSVFRVAASDSTITLQTGTSTPMVARLAFSTFLTGANGYTILFTRAGGRVTGFEVTNGRTRRVRFTEEPLRSRPDCHAETRGTRSAARTASPALRPIQ